jgi:hypothetical protein
MSRQPTRRDYDSPHCRSAEDPRRYLVSCYMLVDNTVPSLMLSVSIATSIDYSLFLLSRFREEIEKRRSPARAVELMMSAAGHTVLVSGSTLAFCFAGLAAFPVQMFRTMGIGAGCANLDHQLDSPPCPRPVPALSPPCPRPAPALSPPSCISTVSVCYTADYFGGAF